MASEFPPTPPPPPRQFLQCLGPEAWDFFPRGPMAGLVLRGEQSMWSFGPLIPPGLSCHGLWMENVQLFILCTQFVNVFSVFSKQAAFLREGCLFIPQPWLLA